MGRPCFGLELGDAALEALTRAVEIQPNLVAAYYLVALGYLHRDNKSAARTECDSAHAMDSSPPRCIELEQQME